MLSLQLYVEGDNLGALNLYSRTPGAFDDESEQVGLLFASHAAVAYAGVRKEAQLAKAVQSRDLIGQAKGILMEVLNQTPAPEIEIEILAMLRLATPPAKAEVSGSSPLRPTPAAPSQRQFRVSDVS